MIKETIKLQLEKGLEARRSALFVQLASKFESNITIIVADKHVNCKSIMGMMALGAIKCSEVELVVDGDDEQKAMEELKEFLVHEEVPA
ncbi:PTS sugar transporter subunit IIA [Candidatus Epulonipiscium fishelsonii]|uniref:PTS sugar transporter subunit IIA n=1 Tax=Candidatus Epulonipiscium fishelsonii TaxID=77094 RepID=A0ACC8X7E7_9FIRM|nr:PTS sugar transporter subunit IIA [Epulopiscium sp. SCG-D08WGA-EpuloA1]OON97892.1 MAG: PTS sugar transporter subunit IIA [Epulopiscium sp. AS2M-Bin002]